MYKVFNSITEKENAVVLKKVNLEDFITEVRNSELEIKSLSDEAIKALFDFIEEIKNDYILDLDLLNSEVKELVDYKQILEYYPTKKDEIYEDGIVIELHNGNILFIQKPNI